MKKILITGGAGYIGSHTVKLLGEQLKGANLYILDDLSTGHQEAILFGEFVKLSLNDQPKVEELFKRHKFDLVIHFAGSIVVPESVSKPLDYYYNNTVNSHFLLSLCEKYDVNNFIFSSTAAVYGDNIEDSKIGAKENNTLAPTSPYGVSKLMTEHMIQDYAFANKDFKYAIIRYFNVAGADPDEKLGQSFPNATHLIKICAEVVAGKRDKVKIFGTDYETEDGTCMRDYIHVTDLAQAHVDGVNYLFEGNESTIVNCGYGKGYSVREIVNKVKEVSGVDFSVDDTERRPGDPAIIISNAHKIKKVFKWKPKYNDISKIIETALNWERIRPF
ncbi:UDP-glucose 4-epimerase GalE [Bacteriovoracaceae bacterium]|nr:UDP-glucose 4-epimerase GalE [Bacteriovoracaceae bacterium]